MRCVARYALLLMLGASAWGQGTPDISVGGALRSLATRAGVVFVGQVVRVEPKAGVVEVTFRVEQAVQGAVGASYVLREWAGLWANGRARYVTGQRAMVFLHAPSAAGMSTPVDGMEGVVPVVAASADAAPMLDARWVAARVQRAVGAPMVAGTVAVSDAVAAVQSAQEPVLRAFPVTPRPLPALPVRISGAGSGGGSVRVVQRRAESLLQPMVRYER